MSQATAPSPAATRGIAGWGRSRFAGVDRTEAWGYGVWSIFGVIVAVPELWAAVSSETAWFPTISATVGYLEYHHVWVSIPVVSVIVGAAYGALRPPEKTGVLPRKGEQGKRVQGDPALPDRTAEGGRLTRSKAPVREIGAGVYFAVAVVVTAAGTAIAVWRTGGTDEHAVGQVLYGSIAFLLVVVPTVAAWPKRWAVDIPFPTLLATVRNLERRLRIVAVVVTAGLAYLLIHLVFYPWPATIPDVQDLHDQLSRERADVRPIEPAPPEPTAP
jgi:hypothetical protein